MKATKAQVQLRVEEVLRIRLDGAEFWDVREYAREKEKESGSPWELKDGAAPISDGQLWRYVARADEYIAVFCRTSRKKLMRRHLAQRRNLYAKAVNAGDVRTALAVIRDEALLEGLYPPAKIAQTNPGGDKEANSPRMVIYMPDNGRDPVPEENRGPPPTNEYPPEPGVS